MSYAMVGLGAVPSASELGQIKAKDGWSYQLTPDDVLWLARSVECEGGNRAATMWTYAQRLASRHGSSLAALVRGHSQPVNPAWASASTPLCVRYPDHCSPASLARRAECASKPWDDLADHQQIVQWAQAGVQNPVPGATDFADATVSASWLLHHPDSAVVLRSGNWYIAEGPSTAPRAGGPTHWPSDFVTIEYNGRTAGPSIAGRLASATTIPVYIPGLAVLGTGAAFAWLAYSKNKGGKVRRNRRRR
jgi:hypothetical protein